MDPMQGSDARRGTICGPQIRVGLPVAFRPPRGTAAISDLPVRSDAVGPYGTPNASQHVSAWIKYGRLSSIR